MEIIHEIAQKMLIKLMELDVLEGIGKYMSDAKEICLRGILDLATARIEEADQAIFNNKKYRKAWEAVKKGQQRVLLTECGTLTYKRRYYKNKKNKKNRAYLVDHLIGVEKYDRVEKGLAAKICNSATEHSYTKSSQIVCDGAISRQTVKNKIRQVKEEKIKVEEVREEVKVLHIQADEDHVAMQDGRRDAIVKLVTLHEPAKTEGSRTYLPHRFCIESYGENVEDMWIRVADAINERYGLRDDLRVYIHGDGASWIKTGLEWINNSKFVLDRYHLNKYLKPVSGGDSELQKELFKHLKADDYRALKKHVADLASKNICTLEASDKFLSYVKTNREGIKIWYDTNETPGGSCAEGLVSHVLSARLSSRPRGWLDAGLKAVSRLRVYTINGGVIKPEHFAKSKDIIDFKKRRVYKTMTKASSFAPLPTDKLKATRCGRPEYRLFKAIVNGGLPIDL